MLRLKGTELVSLDDLNVPGEPVEDGLTFETNARIKARYAARLTGLPALADDSGIEVEALGGAPGVRTRRYAGPDATDDDNNEKLLRELADVPLERRGARYVCALALAVHDETAPGGLRILVRRGTTRGRITFEPRGSGGFGYDPAFVSDDTGPDDERTMAELTAEEKAAVSHRGRAARKLAAHLAGGGARA
jgi:XTP/dITP diphosphohydrolase